MEATAASGDVDPFSWLDELDGDDSDAAAARLDESIDQNSIIPHSDSDDGDDEDAGEQKQSQRASQRHANNTASVAWAAIRALPTAPLPSDWTSTSGSSDTSDSAAPTAQLTAGTTAGVVYSSVTSAPTTVTLAEREQQAAASGEAARRRVRRMIAQAEERRQALHTQQQQQQQSTKHTERTENGGVICTVRARSSDDRHGSAGQRKIAGVQQLSALPQRPPTQ